MVFKRDKFHFRVNKNHIFELYCFLSIIYRGILHYSWLKYYNIYYLPAPGETVPTGPGRCFTGLGQAANAFFRRSVLQIVFPLQLSTCPLTQFI